MGIYINPKNQTKENWLVEHCTEMMMTPPERYLTKRGMIVVLVNNGAFSAAGVAWSQRELEEFSDPQDPRIRVWFRVPVAKLEEVTGEKLGE